MRRYTVAIASICILCVGFAMVPSSDALFHDRPCSVRIDSMQGLLPVTYNSKARQNSDYSVYPGDGIHFLFRFSGSETCQSFKVKPLVGSENLNIRSALMVSGDDSPKPHSVIIYKWIPKHLTTFHWYEIVRYTEPYPHNHHCKCAIHIHTDPIFSDNPIFSYREDVELSSSDAKKIDHYRKSGKYQKTETQSWHLVKEMIPYNVGVEKHVLEDNNSVNSFVNIINSNCSNLSKNQGCVFGHIEIPTITNDKKQTCLFEELDSLSVKYDGVVWSEDKETRTYGGSSLVDHCIPNDAQNKLNITVSGTGISCDGDGKCKSYVRTDDSSVAPNILSSFGEISFTYPQLYDPDGFPAKNNDGTYYLDNPIGIHGIPDVPFKEERGGTLSFLGDVSSNPLHMMDYTSCNDMCKGTLSGEKMSLFTHLITNGDMLSAHFTPDTLGTAQISHVSKMYNIERYIGEYTGMAKPLIVLYDPQIISTITWSRLADGGYQSFDNRYGIAIQYAGSFGGGPDDGGNSTIHRDRPVKITDVYSAYFMSNSFGDVSMDWRPDGALSGAHGLSDGVIHESIYPYIDTNHTFVDSFPDAATIHWNGTVQDTMIDSAGYARILRDVDVSQDLLEKYHVNVTSYDTLLSRDYGGVENIYLASSVYDFPWGYFTTPLNVTAYHINNGTKQDVQVAINHINSSDSKDLEFVSAVEFYLNKHDSPEFAFLHMADLYHMNSMVSFDGNHTVRILLNKTGIHYDNTAYNKAVRDEHLGELYDEFGKSDILNMTAREFFVSSSYYDVEISASRNNTVKTNVIQMGGAELSNIIKYKINMNLENDLSLNQYDDTVTLSPNSYFGDITDVFVNDKPYNDTTCNTGCIVFLSDNTSDVSIFNVWGGVATAKNLTDNSPPDYTPESWVGDTPIRLFWIFFTVVMLYVGYRAIKMIYHSRKG